MAGSKKARAKAGEAIPAEMRTVEDVETLRAFLANAKAKQRHQEIARFQAVLGYIEGRSAIEMAKKLKTDRSCVNKWLGWYATAGVEGLLTKSRPGAPAKLTKEQKQEIAELIKGGPIAAGYTSGVWTGPMVGDLIMQRFGVKYHNEYVPRLLNKLGFSVQRPRKRLAKADAEAQRVWIEERLPEIKKKRTSAEG